MIVPTVAHNALLFVFLINCTLLYRTSMADFATDHVTVTLMTTVTLFTKAPDLEPGLPADTICTQLKNIQSIKKIRDHTIIVVINILCLQTFCCYFQYS